LKNFYNVRLEYYKKRKARLLQKLDLKYRLISNKVRFIKMILDD